MSFPEDSWAQARYPLTGEPGPGTAGTRPLLARIIDAVLAPRAPDPDAQYDGPCAGGTGLEAWS